MKYEKKFLDLFLSPINAGHIKYANATAKVVNKECGDIFKLYAILKHGKINEIKFQAFGSVYVFAAMSVVTELIKNKSISDLKEIKISDLQLELNGFPKSKETILNNTIAVVHKLADELEKYENDQKTNLKSENNLKDNSPTKSIELNDNNVFETSQKVSGYDCFCINSSEVTLPEIKSEDIIVLSVDKDEINLIKDKLPVIKSKIKSIAKDDKKETKTMKLNYIKKESDKNKSSSQTQVKKTQNIEVSLEEVIKEKVNRKTRKKKDEDIIIIEKNPLLDDDNYDMVDEIDDITARLSEAVAKLKNKTDL